jgi:hypothetical protein
MTLAELSDAWNSLRNAVLGQGTTPPKNVKPETATKIGNYYDRWRQWYSDAGVTADMAASVSASQWVDLYREAVKLAQADGVDVPAQLLPTALEQATAAAQSTGKGIMLAAAIVAVPLVLLLALRGQR